MHQLNAATLPSPAGPLGAVARLAPPADAPPIPVIQVSGDPVQTALAILFLSGLSITLGESVVLFANQVSRPRFILSLILSAALVVLSVVLWAGSIWFIARSLFDAEQPFENLLIIVSLSYTPLMLGFLVLLPYLGNLILHLLNIWTFLATLGSVAFVYRFNFWQALLCTAAGWVFLELLTRLPVVNIKKLDSLLWRLSTGKPRALSVEDVVEHYVRQARAEAIAAQQARGREA